MYFFLLGTTKNEKGGKQHHPTGESESGSTTQRAMGKHDHPKREDKAPAPKRKRKSKHLRTALPPIEGRGMNSTTQEEEEKGPPLQGERGESNTRARKKGESSNSQGIRKKGRGGTNQRKEKAAPPATGKRETRMLARTLLMYVAGYRRMREIYVQQGLLRSLKHVFLLSGCSRNHVFAARPERQHGAARRQLRPVLVTVNFPWRMPPMGVWGRGEEVTVEDRCPPNHCI